MGRAKKFRAGLLAWLLFLFCNSVFAKPEVIRIGFIPGLDPGSLKKNAVELVDLLQKEVGVPMSVYISKDYSGLAQAMKKKKVDFAFFSPITFVNAEKKLGVKVLLKKVYEEPFYYSSILTLKKSQFRSIKDLKNKRIAFVDKKSASGYLYPRLFLKKQNIKIEKFFKKTVFSGNHDRSVELLRDGKVDAVAVFANDRQASVNAWTKHLGSSRTGDVRSLWVSEPIPNDPFCVRQEFYDKFPKISHDMMFALFELGKKDGQNHLQSLLGVKRMELATSQQYNPVRELVKVLGVGFND